MLYELCQKDGKHVDIKHWRKEEKDIASVYVDGQFVVSATSENKENAKLHAAKSAITKLACNHTSKLDLEVEPNTEFGGAKQKLNELCGRKKWPAPTYRLNFFSPTEMKSLLYTLQTESLGAKLYALLPVYVATFSSYSILERMVTS